MIKTRTKASSVKKKTVKRQTTKKRAKTLVGWGKQKPKPTKQQTGNDNKK